MTFDRSCHLARITGVKVGANGELRIFCQWPAPPMLFGSMQREVSELSGTAEYVIQGVGSSAGTQPQGRRLDPRSLAGRDKAFLSHRCIFSSTPCVKDRCQFLGICFDNPQWDIHQKPGKPRTTASLSARSCCTFPSSPEAMMSSNRTEGARVGSKRGLIASSTAAAKHYDRDTLQRRPLRRRNDFLGDLSEVNSRVARWETSH